MKKLMCVVVCLAVLGGIVFSAGCGGGGGGGIGAILAGALIVAAIASSGGAGAAAFAASVRERPATAIYSQTATSKYKAKIIVKDAAGSVVTSTETTKLYVDSTGKQLSFDKITFSLNEGKYDVAVEYYAANAAANAEPFYKKYEYSPVSGGSTTDKSSLTVTATDTAYALTYDSWKTTKTGATSVYFSDFYGQSPNVSSVTNDIVAVLNTLGASAPPDTFAWTSTTRNDASAVAASTTVPSSSSSTSQTEIWTMVIKDSAGVVTRTQDMQVNFSSQNSGTISYSGSDSTVTYSGSGSWSKNGSALTFTVRETGNQTAQSGGGSYTSNSEGQGTFQSSTLVTGTWHTTDQTESGTCSFMFKSNSSSTAGTTATCDIKN